MGRFLFFTTIYLWVSLCLPSCLSLEKTQNINYSLDCDLMFQAIEDNDKSLIEDAITNNQLNFNCRDSIWGANLCEYAMSKHKNEITLTLLKYLKDNFPPKKIKQLDLLRGSIMYGNTEVLSAVTNMYDSLGIRINHKKSIQALSWLIFNHYEAKDNNSEFVSYREEDVDYKMIDIFINNELLNINAIDEKDQTILFPVSSCCPSQLDYLLRNTAIDVNFKNKNGQTVLDVAMKSYMFPTKQHPTNDAYYIPDSKLLKEVVDILVKHGGRTSNNESPYNTLCKWGIENSAMMLLENMGCTP